ncbi:hypothetical protein DAPPUDRAFT_341424, partial [Daphnia pulex]
MATDTQLKKLRVAKRWEVDATFQIVPDPFYQLFAVHTSIRKGPFGTLRLVAVSLDFESGLWGAFSTVFPN